jgi:hypothetical protein
MREGIFFSGRTKCYLRCHGFFGNGYGEGIYEGIFSGRKQCYLHCHGFFGNGYGEGILFLNQIEAHG